MGSFPGGLPRPQQLGDEARRVGPTAAMRRAESKFSGHLISHLGLPLSALSEQVMIKRYISRRRAT